MRRVLIAALVAVALATPVEGSTSEDTLQEVCEYVDDRYDEVAQISEHLERVGESIDGWTEDICSYQNDGGTYGDASDQCTAPNKWLSHDDGWIHGNLYPGDDDQDWYELDISTAGDVSVTAEPDSNTSLSTASFDAKQFALAVFDPCHTLVGSDGGYGLLTVDFTANVGTYHVLVWSDPDASAAVPDEPIIISPPICSIETICGPIGEDPGDNLPVTCLPACAPIEPVDRPVPCTIQCLPIAIQDPCVGQICASNGPATIPQARDFDAMMQCQPMCGADLAEDTYGNKIGYRLKSYSRA